ncbi:MAG TPA: epoxyqueuosine reductase QueH [Spirochaetota bacterium]|nr:epoxyqueuosine reductase QueH [Spirochaetota bacterium]
MKKDTLLLHACCAPCAAHVIGVLGKDFNITAYFYNPNISPFKEYSKRLSELEDYSVKRGFPLVVGLYDPRKWTSAVKVHRFEGERSVRCMFCFRYRLEECFRYARDNSFDAVATVMSVSPHKDAAMLNETGRSLKRRYGIEFFEADFKKNDGYRKSVEISRTNGFYRQDYCGCVYSSMERKINSLRKTSS